MIATNKTDIIETDQAAPIFQVSNYTEGEEPDIVNLLMREMSGWPFHNIKCSPLEHWMWKHIDSPTGLMNVVVARSHGKIVGCNHSHTNLSLIHI